MPHHAIRAQCCQFMPCPAMPGFVMSAPVGFRPQ